MENEATTAGPMDLLVMPNPVDLQQIRTMWADVEMQLSAYGQDDLALWVHEQVSGPTPPHECKTESEKLAFAFGWWKAMEHTRHNAGVER